MACPERHYFDGSDRHVTKKFPHGWFQKHCRKQEAKLCSWKKMHTILLMITLIRNDAPGTTYIISKWCPHEVYNILSSLQRPVWKAVSITVMLLKLFWLPNYWQKAHCVQDAHRWSVSEWPACTCTDTNLSVRNDWHTKELNLTFPDRSVSKLRSPGQQRSPHLGTC